MKNSESDIQILPYNSKWETEWVYLRARIVARSHSWDFVERKKVVYENDSIELVGFLNDELIGYVDAEIDKGEAGICWLSDLGGAVVQEFGVKPELHGKGYGKELLSALINELKLKGVTRIEFWTKDPKAAKIYEHWGFAEIFRHTHFRSKMRDPNIEPMIEFGYYITDKELPKDHIKEVPLEPHLCYGFELLI